MSVRNLLTDNKKTWASVKCESLTLATGPEVNIIDIDDTMGADSDARLASQKAIKGYVDAAIVTEDLFDVDGEFLYPKNNKSIRIEPAGSRTGLNVQPNGSGNAEVRCFGDANTVAELKARDNGICYVDLRTTGNTNAKLEVDVIPGNSSLTLQRESASDFAGINFRTGADANGWALAETTNGFELVDEKVPGPVFQTQHNSGQVDFISDIKCDKYILTTTDNYIEDVAGDIVINSVSGAINITNQASPENISISNTGGGTIGLSTIGGSGNVTLNAGVGDVTLNSNSGAVELRGNTFLMLEATGGGLFSTFTAGHVVTGNAMHINGSTGNMGILSSTIKSKMNVENLKDVDFLYKLNPIKFDYKKRKTVDGKVIYMDEPEIGQREYGFFAESVEKVNPDFCIYDRDDKLLGLKYDRLITPIIKALQDQKKEIDSLKDEVALLKKTKI